MSTNPIQRVLLPLYNNEDEFRLSNLINGLILFDQVIIDSRHLQELRNLIDLFSLRKVKRLIKSGKIDIKGGHITTAVQLQRVAGNDFLFLVRPMQLAPNPTKNRNIQELTEYIISNNDQSDSLISKVKNKYRDYQRNKLINTIDESYTDYPDDTFTEFSNKVRGIISEQSILREGILNYSFAEYLNSDDSNNIEVVREGDEIFRINFNNPPTSDNEVQVLNTMSTNFLLGMGNIMRNNFNEYYFNCLVGLKNSEIEFQRLNSRHIYEKFNADRHFERHERVLRTNNLPFVDERNARQIKFRKLLKVLNSTQIANYRTWLWNIDRLENDEITEKASNFAKKIDRILRVPIAKKSIDFFQSVAVSTATGDLTGMSGEITGHFIEKYLFKKLKREGHYTFINDIYPSIFKEE